MQKPLTKPITQPIILIAEDSEPQRFLLAQLLKNKMGFAIREATNGSEALRLLADDEHRAIAIVLLDLEMPEMDGREALPKIRALRPDVAVIVLTGTESVSDVVEVMKNGASDFLRKPPDVALLKQAVHKALHVRQLEHEIETLQREKTGQMSFAGIIGQKGLHAQMKLAQRAAGSDIPVLITGESGTGKEIFARAIHHESARKQAPFIAVNCGALPKDLIESVLFGHKKGAFTGAVADALGKFREAEGGTLFLDEIGELPLDAQVKLLRVLQAKEVEPVGHGKAVPINVRIIAATNRNLLAEVKRGHVREDLFYRLNVFPIHLPPLRLHKGDVEELALYFIRRYAAQEKKGVIHLGKEAADWLQQHNWPGNIREMENTLYRAVLLCEGDTLTCEHMLESADAQEQHGPATHQRGDNTAFQIYLKHPDGAFKTVDELQMEAMRAALEAHDGHVTKAATALGISKSTFYRLKKG